MAHANSGAATNDKYDNYNSVPIPLLMMSWDYVTHDGLQVSWKMAPTVLPCSLPGAAAEWHHQIQPPTGAPLHLRL